jgi:3-oxoacyl-[acyl-carrier protein] reductase
MSLPPNERRTLPIPTYPDLIGKVAVVTGGSGGIGVAACRALAANGVKVAVNGRDDVKLAAVVSDIQARGGQALGIAADVTDFAAIERMRLATEGAFGAVDILVAFAGGGQGRPTPVAQMSMDDWHATINANLSATFLTLRSFLPGMIERRRGAIITMASVAGRIPTPASAAYAAAKAGIIMLSRQVADEVGKHGIRVNCVAPSTILTEQIEQYLSPERQQQMTAQHPLGRLGMPEDVALATLYLASDASSWITGITLDVAGGKIMR